MDNIDKYIKYKTKYLQLASILKGCHENNMIGGGKINFLIIGNIRGNDLEFIPQLKRTLKSLNGNVKEYKFKFKNKPFILDDLTFESVSNHIKLFINKKKLSDCIIICLEESSPYGLFFADMYPEMCKAIICYPLRLNTKESLDRLYHKYVKKNGWKYISNNYDPIDYFFEINDKRLNELFDKNEITSERSASKKLWLGDKVPLTNDHSSVLAETTQTYNVPYHGLNSMNIMYYTKISKTEANLAYDMNSSCSYITFKTTKNIEIGQELIVPGFKVRISTNNPNKKKALLENLNQTYTKLGKSNIQGIGIITIKKIPINTNPFIITNNLCVNFNGTTLSKNNFDKLNNEEVKKMIKDFIYPDDNMSYYLPTLGLNSLRPTFYLNHSTSNNLKVVSDGCEYMGFNTLHEIDQNMELFINYGEYTTNFMKIMGF